MKPTFFAGYLAHLEKLFMSIDENSLNGWGEAANDLPF
jgi:hypothetical protein